LWEQVGVSVREGPRTATGRSPCTVKGAARRPCRAVRSRRSPRASSCTGLPEVVLVWV